MKILIAGWRGFIGSHLTERLLELGHEVIGIDNGSTGKYRNSKVTGLHIDLCNTPEIDLKGVEAVFHVAAVARIPQSYDRPQHYYYNNVVSTLNLLEACRKQGVKKFIYSSSSSVFEPNNPYAHSKLIGEELCEMYFHLYGMDIQILRYFNVYGNRMASGGYATVLQKFKDRKDKNEPLIIFGDGNQKRDFTFVDDIVNANLLMLEQNKFDIYDVGSQVNYPIIEIAEAFNHPIVFEEGFVGRSETLADISKIQKIGYSPTGNVLNWIKQEFMS